MSRQILQDIINNFRVEKFISFFRSKSDKFRPRDEPFHYEDKNFHKGKELGKITFDDGNLMACSFFVKKELSERSGKKAQYELGKKILKDTQTDSGIFIFYDKSGNFRFSLIYANYLGRRRDWSTFRRFTYFVSKELTNKTFLQRIGDGDFSSLAKIKEAFSVEKVTNEFYEEIANWYFWAVERCRFPKDAEIEDNGRNVAVIRLITRMIFIWFMRERGLVPKELFEENNIRTVLKDIDSDNSTYYRAILQNLFFATLSTKKEERQFREEKRFNKGWNKDFGNQYVFRYHELFTKPEKIKDYFGNIPFLNGGLFECLDDGKNDIYIDGFTERKKEYQPQVPNFLFFSGEEKADLNNYYGTKGKNYKVRGLLNILSSFNFTIDENSPDDVDIALDPELLGRVFENLLASFNPETSTTARKATGSYYTPREIVDYMVTESLKAYFKTRLADVQDIDKKLETLLATGSDENPFSKEESKKLVELIESVRIVDPAVGSGAFPMGALNKMVFILNKIDPGNELWKQAQLKAVEIMPDPQVRRNTQKQIEEFFKDKNADYGRKLYLIQKCIYGVDIQQIAVEIAKLRFFISLLVDEKIDETKPNWDIQPLPNLDFKIMRGNSLQSVETEDLFGSHNKKRLEELKEQLFFEPDHDKKKNIKLEIDRLFNELTDNRRLFDFELYFSEVFNKNGSQDVGFDIVLANPPYLGEKGHKEIFQEIAQSKIGKRFYQRRMDIFYFFFHLALNIGRTNSQIAFITTNYYPTSNGAQKLREDFKTRATIHKLVNLHELKIFKSALGQHSMITILQKSKNVGQKTEIYSTRREGIATDDVLKKIFNKNDEDTNYCFISQENLFTGRESIMKSSCNTNNVDDKLDVILDKVASAGTSLDFFCDIKQGIITGADKITLSLSLKYGKNWEAGTGIFILEETELKNLDLSQKEKKDLIKNWITTDEVLRWTVKRRSTPQYIIYITKDDNLNDYPAVKKHLGKFKVLLEKKRECIEGKIPWYSLNWPRKKQFFEQEKILTPYRSEINRFSYDDVGYYTVGNVPIILKKTNSILDLKFILALLNSRIINFWYKYRGKEAGGEYRYYLAKKGGSLAKIPLVKISKTEQKPFIDLVDKILAITSKPGYNPKNPSQEQKNLEAKIDQLVYNLYDLTLKEREIIKNFNNK